MNAACENNSIVKESWNMPERIQQIAQRFKPPVTDDTPF